MSGAPQGSVLGLVPFNIFVGDMDSGTECKFAEDTKLCGAVDMLAGRDAIQRDLDRLETWTHVNFLRFSKAKCKVLHLGRGNAKHKYRLDGEWIERSPEQKDLGVLVDKGLNMTQWCALTAQKINRILGCIPSSMASRLREGILPLCSGETSHGVLCPALEPPAQERQEPVEAGPEEATLEHLCCEDRLRLSGLFSLEKRRLWGNLRAAFQCLKLAYKKVGEGLFTRVDSDRTRGNGFKLKDGRFRLDVRKKFFPARVVKHWNRLLREAVAAPSLAVFKARLDGALSSLV